jgi:4-hydroxy-3-polyprenylbenzoate decarboxylase
MLKGQEETCLGDEETPLSDIYLRNMLEVSRSGGDYLSAMPSLLPGTVEDLVDQSVGRILDLFDLDTEDFERWNRWKKE